MLPYKDMPSLKSAIHSQSSRLVIAGYWPIRLSWESPEFSVPYFPGVKLNLGSVMKVVSDFLIFSGPLLKWVSSAIPQIRFSFIAGKRRIPSQKPDKT